MIIHPNFKQQEPILLDLDKVVWNLHGINDLLDEILTKVDITYTEDRLLQQANIVRDIVNEERSAINSRIDVIKAVDSLDRDIVRDIANRVERGIDGKIIKVLREGKKQRKRKDLLEVIGLTNNVKNFDTYIGPLVQLSWLAMTIPDKPTSPKQQYLTTLKGRLILQLLKHRSP